MAGGKQLGHERLSVTPRAAGRVKKPARPGSTPLIYHEGIVMRFYLISLCALLVLPACQEVVQPPADRVFVQTDRAAYAPGDLIITTTYNDSDATISDYHCGGEVQGTRYGSATPGYPWSASYGYMRGCGWLGGPPPGGVHPNDTSIAIPPGGKHVDTLHVAQQSYAGNWRVLLSLRSGMKGELLPERLRASNEFAVIRPE